MIQRIETYEKLARMLKLVCTNTSDSMDRLRSYVQNARKMPESLELLEEEMSKSHMDDLARPARIIAMEAAGTPSDAASDG